MQCRTGENKRGPPLVSPYAGHTDYRSPAGTRPQASCMPQLVVMLTASPPGSRWFVGLVGTPGPGSCQRDLGLIVFNMVSGVYKALQYCDCLPFPSRFLYGPLLTPFFLSLRCESIHSSAIPYLTQRRQGRASSHFLQAF